MLSDLIPLVIDITSECTIGKLGPPYTYQYADEVGSNVLAKGLIDVDIKSAFPTICKLMFGEDHPFVQNIFAIDDKLKRNIYISTTLKAQSQVDNKLYLNDLNLWSKNLILGYIYSKYTNITILQYVKDGLVIKADSRNEIEKKHNEMLDYIVQNDILFHERPIDVFIRFNKTSITKFSTGKVTIKGNYKDCPSFIVDQILPSFFNGDIYDYTFLNQVKKIYTPTFYKILLSSGLGDEINKYFLVNNQYLATNGALSSLEKIAPKAYLTYIIYPVLSLFRINQNTI